MPQIQTRDFGALEYDPEAILQFPHGLPGFELNKRFVLIEQEALRPVIAVQSMDAADLCFLTVPVSFLDAEYQSGIAEDDLELLGLDRTRQPDPAKEILCLAILAATEEGDLSANLLAPIVVNLATRESVQAVRTDTRYSHRHPVGSAAGDAQCL